MLGGRLTINIISSELPGETLDSPPLATGARWRSWGFCGHCSTASRSITQATFYRLTLDPPNTRTRTLSGVRPPMYFGGLSPRKPTTWRREAADVYLMWPETEVGRAAELIADIRARAAHYERTLRFGFRSHVIVRETEAEARAYAGRLLSRELDDGVGAEIRARSLDSHSTGVRHQAELRARGRRRRLRRSTAVDRNRTTPAVAVAQRSSAMPIRCSRS